MVGIVFTDQQVVLAYGAESQKVIGHLEFLERYDFWLLVLIFIQQLIVVIEYCLWFNNIIVIVILLLFTVLNQILQ